jgi:hypothetical protein
MNNARVQFRIWCYAKSEEWKLSSNSRMLNCCSDVGFLVSIDIFVANCYVIEMRVEKCIPVEYNVCFSTFCFKFNLY